MLHREPSRRHRPESSGGGHGRSTATGEVAKRSNATDCKSVAHAASKVRILPSPPAFAERSRARPSAGRARRRGRRRERRKTTRVVRAKTSRRVRGDARAERGGGSNSVVESQPSKLLVAGSIPVSRSSLRDLYPAHRLRQGRPGAGGLVGEIVWPTRRPEPLAQRKSG